MTQGDQIQIFANLCEDSSYRLMELSPELLQLIETEAEPLCFKSTSNDSEVVLCSSNKTFEIKQRNHSNTVLVMKQESDSVFRGYSSQPFIYEFKPTQGKIDITSIPIYDGQEKSIDQKNMILVEELKKHSPISEGEFETIWFNLNGSSVNGVAVILSDDFLTRSLHILIMSIMAASLDFNELSLIEAYKSVDDDEYTIDVVETVLRKFSINDKEPYKMDRTKVSQWYGITALKKYASRKALAPSELLIKWKSEFPPFFECSIDFPLLSGNYVKPLPDRIQYIARDRLSTDINGRLKELFKLQSTWELNEIIPFLKEFNTKGVKDEVFIMKYAKKKRVGRKIIVSSK